MTAEQLGSLVERYGLPLLMLTLFAWAILKRKLVTGAESEGWKTLYERERVDRIAAEQTLAKFGGASVEVAEAVREALDVIGKTPYAGRLEGRRDR